MNPFPFLLIFRIQEGMLSAQCLEHIVPLSLQYESNYKKGGGVGGYVPLISPANPTSSGAIHHL